MKTLHRFLQVGCLAAVLVVAQSTACAVIYEEIMNFTYPNSLPVSLSGGIEVDTFQGQFFFPATIDSNGMYIYPGANNAIRCSFSLVPAGPPGWHLIGFGMAAGPKDPILGLDEGVLGPFFFPSLRQTTGLSWSMSDVPPALLDGPTVFADPGSYITSFESGSDRIFSYDINAIELFWDVPQAPVPDGGNVPVPFLLTLILLLAGHQLSRVQGLRGHVGR
jgi:hypothetical protein